MNTLSDNVKIMEVLTLDAAANNTDANSDRIDMSGWDGIVFLVPITDSDATGVATLKVEANTVDSDSGMVAITGASAAATCVSGDDLNDTLLIVDVYRPQKRYVQGVITSSVANIAFGNTIAIQYKGSKFPVTQHASVKTIAQVTG